MEEILDTIVVGDIVDFQPYPKERHVPCDIDRNHGNQHKCLGKVRRIGTADELGMMQLVKDDRLFYELETLPKHENDRPHVFTRTTEMWIKKIEK